MGRAYTDIDFAAYNRQTKEIRTLMSGLVITKTGRFLLFRKAIEPSSKGRNGSAYRYIL